MTNLRFLSTNLVKVIGLICASVGAWYMGYLFAEFLPEKSLQTAYSSVQKLGERPLIKAPLPRKQKCSVWQHCLTSEVVYRVLSGAGKDRLPQICVNDELILGADKNGGRGINLVIINPDTLKVIDVKTFDMYEGDFSGPLVDFINKIPDKSIILAASHDEASTKLSDAAKKAFEDLGSKEIRNMGFRSQWVFLARKGAPIPADVEREKIIHSDNSRNRYSGWPAEIQIDGCLPIH
ncbi:protein FAM3B [Gastrophryne carolinensis]